MGGAASAALMSRAAAQGVEATGGVDATLLVTGGAVAFGLGATVWAIKVAMAGRTATLDWSRRLAAMEATLDSSESILASHPGLVLVWDDTEDELEAGWGDPRILGGPAALATLLTYTDHSDERGDNPASGLLEALGDLPLEGDQNRSAAPTLREKVATLRTHGIVFSGAVITDEGRPIECDGRVAGNQVTLWLTDPVVRLAEEAGVVGQARDRAADLHGALNQLDRAPIVAWRRGSNLALEWVNQAYVEMVEAINFAEVIDNQIEIDPAFRPIAERAKEEAERSGRRGTDGVVAVNVKGQRRLLRVIEVPMHGSVGASFGGMAIDITRQERAQLDLKRQQRAHKMTLDQLSTAVAVFDAAQSLEYSNQAFLDLWGLDVSILRTRPSHGELLDLLRHAGKLPAKEDFNAWKTNELRLYTEVQGEDRSANEGAAPDEIWDLPEGKTLRVRHQRHGLGGVSVVFEDITETLRLQSRFQTQISVQRATLNTLAQGVAVFGVDGRLALHNRSFETLWSFSRDQLDDRPHWDSLSEPMAERGRDVDEGLARLKDRIVSLAHEDRVSRVGEELTLKDGRILLPATSPLPDGATLVTFLDITDAREREKDLEIRNQILEDADRIKTRFVDHISYQLRNPLNTIIGFAEMMESEMVGPLNDRQKDYAATILTASNHLLDLVNDIIDLAAIDAGRLGLELQEVDVRDLLESAAMFAALKAEDSEISLKVDCPKDIGTLKADERRLKQVLFNLLANGFSFTQAGGQVVLGARRDGDAIRIWVEDTGRGVSPQDQATVFDRFESAGPGAGAGLGLALVNSFVELHGGFVRLASQEGAGTVVTCHLPVDGPDTLVIDEADEGPDPEGLLADDTGGPSEDQAVPDAAADDGDDLKGESDVPAKRPAEAAPRA
ncbi:sensor histidine kinase [Parvularcula bermudensis]|nr:PAS domain-containing sensor histidine kinase [Parvularcula bermudensis]